MIDITDYEKEIWQSDSKDKVLYIERTENTVGENRITNYEIVSESMEISEILCDEDQIRFGQCNAKQFSVIVTDLKDIKEDVEIKATLGFENGESGDFTLGYFNVKTIEKLKSKKQYKITAYDRMYLFDTDITDWLKSLDDMWFRDFKPLFFEKIGIGYVDSDIPFDDNTYFHFQNFDYSKPITGLILIEDICELNGCFGVINNDGLFEFVFLKKSGAQYPSTELLPSRSTYPATTYIEPDVILNDSNQNLLKDYPLYNDFLTKKIDGIKLITNTHGTYDYGGNNKYYISDNVIIDSLVGNSEAQKEYYSQIILYKIGGVIYTPCDTVKAKGLPYVELGDVFQFETEDYTVQSYVLRRKLKGIKSLTDTYESKGSKSLSYTYDSYEYDVVAQKTETEKIKEEISTNNASLEQEISRAKSRENSLETAINTNSVDIILEKKNRSTADKNLQEQITGTTTSIRDMKANLQSVSSNVSELKKEVNKKANSNDLTSEISRAKESESSLDTKILGETSRATKAESNLDAKIDTSYANSNAYTDKKIADLIGGAPTTLDTLKEIADAMSEQQTVVEALDNAIGSKANQVELDTHTENDVIHITASEREAWNSTRQQAQETANNLYSLGLSVDADGYIIQTIEE